MILDWAFVLGQIGRRQPRGGLLGHQLWRAAAPCRGRSRRRRAPASRGAGRMGRAASGSSGRRTPRALALLVLRIEAAQHLAGALIDEMDLAQIPAGVAHLDAAQMPVAVGHLEAAALDDDRAVALRAACACSVRVKASRSASLSGHGRMHLGAGQEARERRLADLGVHGAVVFVLAQACVASFRLASVRSATCSSMAMSRPSTLAPERLGLAVL